MLRDFADTPREEGELGMRASWLTDHFAVNLQGSYVVDPDDDKDWRADGSYLGVNFGNFMLSAGFMERWWGPGWDGSLILSTNARPIPTITLERNYTDPFKTQWSVVDGAVARQHRDGRGRVQRRAGSQRASSSPHA